MAEIILHHYPLSPYSEKVRLALGYKRLPWRSVETPIMLPKPDLLPLTGGYRRAPVLQLGRDIYCDSALILRLLDRLQPEPPLFPAAHRASCAAFAALEQTLFFATVATVFQPAGLRALMDRLGGAETMQQFAQDRAALFAGGSAKRPGAEFGKLNFLPLLNALDQQLAATPYLLGEAPTAADFSMFHPVWFALNNAGVAPSVEPFRRLMDWVGRLRPLSAGEAESLDGSVALELARDATDWQPFDGPALEPEGAKIGMRVQVAATDYGTDPVVGRLVHASVFEFAVRRSDPRAGELTVHFPRSGYAVTPAPAE